MSSITNTVTRRSSGIDAISAQVIWGALESIAIEMGHKLTRMSYSSIIRESEDFGAALLDPDCQQLCESVFSTPLQLGPIPGYVRGIKRVFAERGGAVSPRRRDHAQLALLRCLPRTRHCFLCPCL